MKDLPARRKERVNVFNASTKRIAGIAIFAWVGMFAFLIPSAYILNMEYTNPYAVAMAWTVLFICFSVFMVTLICYLGGIHPSRILQYLRYVQDEKIS